LVECAAIEPVDLKPRAQARELVAVVVEDRDVVEDLADDLGDANSDREDAMRLSSLNERPRAAAVLRWAGSPPAAADRVGVPGLAGEDLLDADVVAPEVAEVVVIDEPLGLPEPELG
jgi:hypothetical protein